MLFCMACAVKDMRGVALPAKTVVYGMAVCVDHLTLVVESEGDLSLVARRLNPDMEESIFDSGGQTKKYDPRPRVSK